MNNHRLNSVWEEISLSHLILVASMSNLTLLALRRPHPPLPYHDLEVWTSEQPCKRDR
jgi:hypothetical protein